MQNELQILGSLKPLNSSKYIKLNLFIIAFKQLCINRIKNEINLAQIPVFCFDLIHFKLVIFIRK